MKSSKNTSFSARIKAFHEALKKFARQHPIIANIIYILLTACVISWLLMCFLDSWTRHGDEAEVPALKGQSVELAEITLENQGFRCEIMDSVYESTLKPGTVVEQNPAGGSWVKEGRTVYLTVVAFSPKMVTVPDFLNVSMRQGRSMFEGLGIKVHLVTVASQFKDLVLGAKVNGVPLKPGQRIPVTSNVTLEVGGGYMEDEDVDPNSVMIDGGNADPDLYDNQVLKDDNEIEDPTVKLLLGD